MASGYLFIIDVQRGFVNEWTRDLPAKVAELQDRFDTVVATRFANPEGSFYRSLIGWTRFAPDSDDVALAFRPRDGGLIVDKAQYSGLVPTVEALLAERRIGRVHLCSIATDNCASHGGRDRHAAGLLLLRRFIGAGQVVSGEPRLA